MSSPPKLFYRITIFFADRRRTEVIQIGGRRELEAAQLLQIGPRRQIPSGQPPTPVQ
jgi:hypothetical protein